MDGAIVPTPGPSVAAERIRPEDCQATGLGNGVGDRGLCGRVALKLKDLVDWHTEGGGQLEGEQQRRDVFSRFQGDDRLAGDADFFGQGLLSHLAIVEPQSSNAICDQVTIRHRREYFHIESGRQWMPLRKQT